MMPRFLLSVLIGFICHQAVKVTGKMPRGWANLTDHTIGLVTLSPVVLMWWRFFHRGDDISRVELEAEIVSAGAVAAIGYGIGNALAWLLDTITGKE